MNKYLRGVELIKNGDGMHYIINGQGDVSMLLNSDGNAVASYAFDAYGNQLSGGTVENPFGYRGEYADAESGLIYLRARMYDPVTGRFLTEDPAHDGGNWYVYCDGDPVNRTDPNGMVSKKVASDVIKRNSEYIKNAGAYYKVNPAIIASCIYTEQITNVNIIDTLTDVPGYIADTSIGVGQVKVSTAKLLEDDGYIASTTYAYSYDEWHSNWYSTKDVWYAPTYGYVEGSREKAIAYRLTVESENVNYVAAYLSYWQDRWWGEYPQIDGKTDVLATLFNQGESRNSHPDPVPSEFGMKAKSEYFYMKELLGLE